MRTGMRIPLLGPLAVLVVLSTIPTASLADDSEREVQQFFADNTQTFMTRDPYEQEILDVMRRIKAGYETGNLALGKKILHDDFYYVYVTSTGIAAVTKPPVVDAKCDDPLPAVPLLVPEPGVPDRYAQFSGVWGGKWNKRLCSRLAVVSIDKSGRAKGVYSWGKGRSYDAGSTTIEGEIEDGKLKFKIFKKKFTFLIDDDGRLKGKRGPSSITMRKLADAKSPSAADDVVEYRIQGRDAYFQERQWWSKKADSSRNVAYAIQSITFNEDRTVATCIALSTYESAYFRPRFIEGLTFGKTKGRWLLRRQSVTLLHPAMPKGHEVDIILAKPPRLSSGKSPITEFARIVRQDGPDAFVELYRSRSKNSIPSNETPHSVLFVFRDAPAPGTEIITEHQFRRPGMGKLSPYRFPYYVKEAAPYYVIENSSQAGGRGGTITYSVFVNGERVAKKKVRIR